MISDNELMEAVNYLEIVFAVKNVLVSWQSSHNKFYMKTVRLDKK